MKIRRLNQYRLFVFVCMFAFFIPHSISILATDSSFWLTIYNVTAIFRCLIAVISISIFVLQQRKPSILVKCVFLYELSVFIACYFNGTITFQFTITNCLTYLGLACFLQMEDCRHDEKFLDGITYFFGTMAIFGALSILLFPNGFNHGEMKKDAIYFLGSKNNGFFYFTIYLYLSVLQLYNKNKKITQYLIVLSCVFLCCTLITNSMTGFITIFLTTGYLIITKHKSFLRRFLTPRKSIFVIAFVAALIPFLAQGKLDWAFQIIGRESDFSGRTRIWSSAIELIKQNPLWGNGKDGDVILFHGHTQAHNIYIDYATKYGFITLSIFILMLILIAVKMAKNTKNDLVYINAFFFFVFFFHSLFDSMTMSFITMVLFYCQKDFNDTGRMENKERVMLLKKRMSQY